jgi:predicted transcriptional regulator
MTDEYRILWNKKIVYVKKDTHDIFKALLESIIPLSMADIKRRLHYHDHNCEHINVSLGNLIRQEIVMKCFSEEHDRKEYCLMRKIEYKGDRFYVREPMGRIFEYLQLAGSAKTYNEITYATGLPRTTAVDALNDLDKLNLVVKSRKKRREGQMGRSITGYGINECYKPRSDKTDDR